MKIAVLAVYFGNLPPFTQLFLASCDKNKSIDFLLVGDAWKDLSGDIPLNCQINPMELDQFKAMVKRTTGFEPHFSSPYKLCDFKPAFGEIFQDELEGYDYWGFTDIDLILGDVLLFLEKLEQYDVFSTREEFLSGPFFLMRNIDKINRLYRKSKDAKRVLTSEQHFCFDECNFAWVELKAGRNVLEVETQIESMTEVIAKAMGTELLAHFETLSLEPCKSFKGRVVVKNGKIMMSGREFVHYHHHLNKGRPLYTYPKWHWTDIPNCYYITRFGVYARGGGYEFAYRYSQFVACWGRRFKKWFFGLFSSQDQNLTKVT